MFLNSQNSLVRFSVLIAFASIMQTSFISPSVAQEDEIEIINQNGQTVDALELQPSARPVEAEPTPEAANNNMGGVQIRQQNGKIVVTDSNGQQRELDVSGAQGVSVTQSTQTVIENGKPVTKTVGKATIVGPDGEVQEIELGDGAEGLVIPGMPEGFANVLKANRAPVSKFMIGVSCSNVSQALRAQLQLDSDSGLLVNHVGQDTPAAAAGLQDYDVILFADDRELTSQQDLVEAVQQAGEANTALSLTIVRAGKEIGIEVSPVERTAEQMQMALPRQMFQFGNFGDFGDDFNDVEFRQFGPGIILGGDQDEIFANMQQQMQQIQEQMQQMRDQMQQRMQPVE